MIGIWLGVSVWLDSACLWITVLAVIDIALLLHLTGVPAGRLRLCLILFGTTLIVIGSQWLIAANAFGLVMGLFPHEAARMIGPVLVWEFSRLRLVRIDMLWLFISVVLAVWLGFRKNESRG